jgi:AAA family ATP:ADP antiporter
MPLWATFWASNQMERPDDLSALERFLRVFTDVRRGEGRTALVMFANVFLILCAYYFIKPLREGWIAVSDISSLSKMEVKAYTSFAQGVLLVGVVAAYSRLADRVPRGALITWATLVCMSNLVVFWFLQPDFFIENLPATGVAFYLWVGMFGVFVVAQFWAFAADLYAREQGERLIPLIAIGATAGAAMGSLITDLLVGAGIVSTEYLLLAALVPLSFSIGLTRLADRSGAGGEAGPPGPDPAPVPVAERKGAFSLIFSSRLLIAVAGTTLLLNWVNTNGENLLFRVVQESLATQAADLSIDDPAALLDYTRSGTTAFYGGFFFWVNVFALLLQAFVASRLLNYGGFALIVFMYPVLALVSYSMMALVPVLAVVRVMKIAENATDYSINNTARSVVWLPVAAPLKFKCKPAIDSLFARIGDGMAALTVLVGVHVLQLSTAKFFAFTVALIVVWLVFTRVIVREHRLLAGTSPAAPPPHAG